MAAIVFAVSAALMYSITNLAGTEWRDESHVGNFWDEGCKSLMALGCQLPGLRLMCTHSEGGPFRLDDVTYWDTVVGCFFYSMAFISVLWLMTPLPDVTAHLFVVVQFAPRSAEDEPQGELIPIPNWHPAGGEGPVLNPPPPVED